MRIEALSFAVALTFIGMATEGRAQQPDGPVNIPLQYFDGAQKLVIYVGINGGDAKPYIFDTGSPVFNAVYNEAWWPGLSPDPNTNNAPGSTVLSPDGTPMNYAQLCLAGGDSTFCRGYTGNLVEVPSLEFYATTSGPTPVATLSANSGGYVVNAAYNYGANANPPTNIGIPFNGPVLDDFFFGTFGAGNFVTDVNVVPKDSLNPQDATASGYHAGGVLGQTIVTGVMAQGYVVAANGQKNPVSSVNPPQQVNGIDVMIGGQKKSVTPCSPCVTVGLTPEMLGQFWAATPTVGGNGGKAGVIPWAEPTPEDKANKPKKYEFQNPYAPGTKGNNASTERGTIFQTTLTPPGGRTSVISERFPGLLDSGTPTLNLKTNASQRQINRVSSSGTGCLTSANGCVVNNGVKLTAAGLDPQGKAIPGLPTTTMTLTDDASGPETYDADLNNSRNTIGISFFLQNSVMYDLTNQVTGYTPFFVTDAPLVTTAGGSLIVDGNNVWLGLAGVISGAGGVELRDGGKVQLSATNSYTGLTQVLKGAELYVSGPGSIAASSGVLNDGVFDISRAWSAVSIQDLTGSGNTYLGGQNLIITNAAGTFSGRISDGGGYLGYPGTGGSLTVAGGALILSGDNTYSGGTSIFDGVLQLGTGGTSGSILGDLKFCSDATDSLCNPSFDKFLVFNRSDTYSFDGTISGHGQLVQNGPGTTILAGDSTYTGPTSVNQGALIVNGSIVSPVNVNFVGLLGGNGSVGATTIRSGGILAPGNSIGTLTMNGGLTLDPGALYDVETNTRGQSDKVIVIGTVNLTGATLHVRGTYKPDTGYLIIDNDGSDAVNGVFGQVTNASTFLTPTVIYDGGTDNDVVMMLERTTLFSDVANTRNQRAVAGALDQFPTDDPLFLAVVNQTAAGARQAFDALSGEVHATVAGTLTNDSRYAREAMLGRMMQATYSDGAGELASLAAAGPQVALLDGQAMALGYNGKSLIEPEPATLAFWTRAFGAWGDFDTDGNAGSADRDLGGFISGMDANIGGSWRIGLATGASFSNVSVDARYSSADVETYDLGGYIGGMAGAVALRGGGMWAWNDIDTSRAVVFPGFYERQAASYNAETGQLFGEVAYPTQMGGVALEPFAGLAYVSIDSGRIREHGGAATSLRGDADQNVGYSTLGLRAAATMHWGPMLVTPHISAAWQHAFDDVTPGAALAFASTGIGFSIAGVPLAEDSVLLDTGLDFALGARSTAGVSYSGQFGDDITDNAVKGRFTWLF
jgi:outer membrane autotransporter protein